MKDFKDAIFVFEMAAVPPELCVAAPLTEALNQLPEAATTLVDTADTLERAALLIDEFKAKTCGSPYSLAIINLNLMNDVRELEFLLRPNVLGDPRTIFLASLRYMEGAAYGLARDKVQRESEIRGRSPSCIYRYGASNREELYKPVSEIAAAYLREAEEFVKARHAGGNPSLVDTHATKLLKKSETAFFGSKLNSGVLRAIDPAAAAAQKNPRASGRQS